MSVRESNPEPVRRTASRHVAVWIGVYTGLALSVSLTAWILVANRFPFLEPFDRERNLAATTLIGLFALIPVMRYMNAPRSLVMSGLVAWGMLSFSYRLLCIFFPRLSGIRTPTQVLMFGALFYLISATVAWMVAVVWKVRQSDSSHSHANR